MKVGFKRVTRACRLIWSWALRVVVVVEGRVDLEVTGGIAFRKREGTSSYQGPLMRSLWSLCHFPHRSLLTNLHLDRWCYRDKKLGAGLRQEPYDDFCSAVLFEELSHPISEGNYSGFAVRA